MRKILNLLHIVEFIASNPTKFCTEKDHQILYVCGLNMRITDLRWRMAAILKKVEKCVISQQRLDWSARNLARWRALWTKCNGNIRNSRWQTAAILKIEEGHISSTVWRSVRIFGKMMHADPTNRIDSW